MKADRCSRALLSLLLLALPCGCRDASADPPALVVLILVDTLRRDSLGCYGAELATPEIDALAAAGVRFEQAISAAGWTLPSAASILTGVSPPVHHAQGKATQLSPISPDLPTGAELLQRAGIRTIAFTNAAFVNPLLGLTRGFEVLSHEHAYNHAIRRADETLDGALAALSQPDGRPTFCLIHLFDPHLDYDPPPGYAPPGAELPLRFEDCTALRPGEGGEHPPPEHVARVRAAYEGEVRFVDAEIGRFVRGLEQRGLAQRATLLLTADHGEEFWEHGGFEHGHTLYDELVHVPLILRPARGQDLAPAVVAAQVRGIDVLPTVFELLGLLPAETFEGRSFLALAHGASEPPRVAFSTGTLYGADRSALRTERHKFVLERGSDGAPDRLPGNRDELYDWVADPGETHNLLAAEPELARTLRSELRELARELYERGQRYREGEVQDLTPEKRAEYLRQLSSLGYARED